MVSSQLAHIIQYSQSKPSEMTTTQTPGKNQKASANAPGKSAAKRQTPKKSDIPENFINRELSWLEFNRRVLEEAQDPSIPLLERVKFLSIFSSNLDEFFMIRVSGLRRQLESGVVSSPPDGMTPAEQLTALQERLEPMLAQVARLWTEDLLPKLNQVGVKILTYDQLKSKQRKLLRRHFQREIFPALTPLAFDPSHPFPHISNLSINLAVVIAQSGQEPTFARLKVPPIFPRLLRIPTEEKAGSYERLGIVEVASNNFVWFEEVVVANLDLLFPGIEIVDAFPFRVTRDADFEIEEDEAADLLSAMEEVVGQRHFGFAVRLEVDKQIPSSILSMLVRNLELAPYQTHTTDGPIGLSDVMELTKLDLPELKDPPFLPHPVLGADADIFAAIRRKDLLLYHPYESFSTVVDFVRQAACDPDVLTIKQTLYRVGPDSPIVRGLMEARENGKQVAVLVELKARFDETNNIVWAKALERAGVHVVYGVLGLKTHAKMCLVVRRETEGIKCYVHLGTGNYNPVTARIYTDLGYLTCNPEIASDVSDLFNSLTGYSRKVQYSHLLVAPASMRAEILRRIDREIASHEELGKGHIVFKLNSLVDRACILALYRASKAGVRVELQIRGICCLRPGVPGLSENITVTSIVGRFLEHSRILYFRNGGAEEIFIGSADLMPRNLGGRVELLVPILDEALRNSLRDDILFTHLQDTHCAQRLVADGTYENLRPPESPGRNTQQEMLSFSTKRGSVA